jgi:DNA-binding MarR family transcriptional regulator
MRDNSLIDKDPIVNGAFPPPYLRDAYLARFPQAALQRLETVFAIRVATQQITNALNDWLEGTAGSPARFRVLVLLWAAGDRWLPHQDIISALQVKRATISALMFSMEQDGLVQSVGDQQDRRRLLAKLTEKGREIIESALMLNADRLEKVFVDLSPDELTLFQSLLGRITEGFLRVAKEPQGDA